MVNDDKKDAPITGICIVSDKNKCPPGYEPITKAHDDPYSEADVWKDGFFSISRIYRYVCVCRTVPSNALVCNVVADIAVASERDLVPPGFVPVEHTTDTNEKALRKKQLCVRSVPRDTAIDAVCDLVILARQKKPPTGYTLAGEIDGLMICFKYGVIPPDFPGTSNAQSAPISYPNLPYPVHPGYSSPLQGSSVPTDLNGLSGGVGVMTVGRQLSSGISGIDGVPFELNALLKSGDGGAENLIPSLKEVNRQRLENEFSYQFRVEQTLLEQTFTNST